MDSSSIKKFDPTKPVQTRDGRKARILCTDMKNDTYPIGAAVMQGEGREVIRTYTADGHERANVRDNDEDLVNVPEETVEWLNYYGLFQYPSTHRTREKADKAAAPYRQALLKVTKVDGKVAKVEVVG